MKTKEHSNSRFLIKWIVANGLVAFLFYAIWMQFAFTEIPSHILLIAGNALEGILYASAQFFTMPKHWRPSATRWFIGSLIASIIGITLANQIFFTFLMPITALLFLIFHLPTALIQAWVLKDRFHKAWLWVIAVIASAFVAFSITTIIPIPTRPVAIAIQTLIPTMQAIITGCVLIFMSQGLKRDDAMQSDKTQDYRIERLAENHSTLDDVVSYNSDAQSDAASYS